MYGHYSHQWSGTELDVAPLTLREVLTLFPEDALPEAVIQIAESLEPALRPHTQAVMAKIGANLTRNYHRLVSEGAQIPARFAPALPAPHTSAPRTSVPRVSARTSAERLDELLRVVDALYREYLIKRMRR